METEHYHFIPSFLDYSQLLAVAFSPGLFGAFLLILLLLYASAMISGSEGAFFSLTHNDFALLREENTKSAKRILELKEKPRGLLATILISNNFINIAIVVVSAFIINGLVTEETFANWSGKFTDNVTYFQGSEHYISRIFEFGITTVTVTFLLVLFGEVAPKIYAKINKIQLAKQMSGVLWFLMRALHPMSRLLVKGTNFIESRLDNQASSSSLREDIDEAINLSVGHEDDTEQEIDILKSIVKFGDVAVKQIMRSRVDVTAVDATISYDELLTTARESGFSRIPVYNEDFDHVTGILYVKDLLGHLREAKDYAWQELIRTNVLYVPESKKIDALLKEFQEERMHLAVVVDEYGGSSGIVTLEDIMEEVIGEIKDEFDDREEVEYKQIDDFNYQFEGKTLINDACRIIGVEIAIFDEVRGESDSVAGLILEMSGFIPKKGAEYFHDDFRFKAVKVGKRRIEQVLITLPDSDNN